MTNALMQRITRFRLANEFPYNFRQLIYGKSFLNIADSFYAVAVSVGLVAVYHIDAGTLSSFTLVSMLPAMFGFLAGPAIDRIRAKKAWLVACQSVYVLLVALIAACLYFRLPVFALFVVNFTFSCVSTLIGAIDTSIVPQALDDDETLIERSVDVQYLTGNILNIASNFVASLLLGVVTYAVVLNVSIPFFVAGIFFFWRMKISVRASSESAEAEPEQHVKRESFAHGIADSVCYFAQQRVPSFIILCEAFLSGALRARLRHHRYLGKLLQ